MQTEQILPTIDLKVLQEKANEAAMKGAIDAINNFYTGYDSPYKKALQKQLEEKPIGTNFELPNIVALINDSLSKEIDTIANSAVANTFVPLIQEFLTEENKQMNFSDVLGKFINYTYNCKYDDTHCEVVQSEHGWLNVKISHDDEKYDLTFHKYNWKNESKTYQVLSLPWKDEDRYKSMELSVKDIKLKIPFSTNVLQNRFTSFIARLIIAKTEITMDTDCFHEDMFPERCHCD